MALDVALRYARPLPAAFLRCLGCRVRPDPVGRGADDRRSGLAFAACLLFAVLPLSISFSIEARMYSMLWFWSISTAWATLMLHDRGPGLRS